MEERSKPQATSDKPSSELRAEDTASIRQPRKPATPSDRIIRGGQKVATEIMETHAHHLHKAFFTRTYGMQRQALNTKTSAGNLIELLKRHYHLKDE